MYEKLKEMSDALVRPKYPSRPKLYSSTPTKEEIDKYNEEVASYDSRMEEYRQALTQFRKDEEVIYEFIKQEAGLYDIPEQYRNKVWSLALGKELYYDIYQKLEELTDIFY